MKTDKKLIVAVLVAAALGIGLWKQKKTTKAHVASHSLEAAASSLPKIELNDEQIASIDTIELYKPAEAKEGDKEGKAAETNVLVKKGEDWELTKPLTAKANASSVKSLIDNLKKLELKEQIDLGTSAYDRWKVSDDKALRAVFKKGDAVVFEAFFGESGSRGQMTRLAGKDGVFTVKGYSKFLYERDTKGWRDKSIFQFDEKESVKVTISNEHGSYAFEKSGDEWKGKHGKTTASGAIKDFKWNKVADMVRAFKGLNATDFGDGKTLEETGLDKPSATFTIEQKTGAKYTLLVGKEGESSSRWAKQPTDDRIFSISSWAGGWILAEPSKFQEDKKADAKKDSDGAGDADEGDMPGMPGMPGMPPGMPDPHGGH